MGSGFHFELRRNSLAKANRPCGLLILLFWPILIMVPKGGPCICGSFGRRRGTCSAGFRARHALLRTGKPTNWTGLPLRQEVGDLWARGAEAEAKRSASGLDCLGFVWGGTPHFYPPEPRFTSQKLPPKPPTQACLRPKGVFPGSMLICRGYYCCRI